MTSGRRAGVMAPLFTLASQASWGLGEMADLPRFARWMRDAGLSVLQLLPITEVAEGETSPYSALTAMALDPVYISIPALEDVGALGGEARVEREDAAAIDRLRRAPRVLWHEVRPLKTRWLRRAFAHFAAGGGDGARARRFADFVTREGWWLDDYATFQALRTRFDRRPWWEWPAPFARRDPQALAEARRELAAEIRYRQYVQWVAAAQWDEARRLSGPLRIFGDVPFMISADSADVWTRPHEFRLDATIGVPPDAFSPTGQDWGLPPWRWEAMAATGFEWMRHRARRVADLADGLRIDHLVGLYRTYVRPLDPARPPFFSPDAEPAQTALGERLVGIYLESGAEVVAEDLGTVPPFVRASLQRLGVPGCKVFRWERTGGADGSRLVDPRDYPEASVATSGTHDIEPLATWWEALPGGERGLVLDIPSVRRFLGAPADLEALGRSDRLPRVVLDAILRALLHAGSRLTIVPLQDVFGWRDRINTPARVGADNWTWRLPRAVDRLHETEEAGARAATLAAWAREAGRL